MAMTEIEAYIRQSAIARGVDPDVAVRVAKSEGGVNDPTRQSLANRPDGSQERSYGPFQLYIDGGLGNRALEAGIDPRNPEHWKAGVDFALNEAAQKGWGQWYGAAKAGIGDYDGIKGAKAAPVSATGTTLTSTPHYTGEIGPTESGAPMVAQATEPEKPKTWADKASDVAANPTIQALAKLVDNNTARPTSGMELTPSSIGVDVGDAGRVQAAQALMTGLMNKKRQMQLGTNLTSLPRGFS